MLSQSHLIYSRLTERLPCMSSDIVKSTAQATGCSGLGFTGEAGTPHRRWKLLLNPTQAPEASAENRESQQTAMHAPGFLKTLRVNTKHKEGAFSCLVQRLNPHPQPFQQNPTLICPVSFQFLEWSFPPACLKGTHRQC